VKTYEELLDKLRKTSGDDLAARAQLYEKLADCAVDMTLPKLALKFYKEQVAKYISTCKPLTLVLSQNDKVVVQSQ